MTTNEHPWKNATDFEPTRLGTRAEAAELAGVHIRTIDYYRSRGYITTYRERGFVPKIDLDELERFLRATPESPDQHTA
jgi:hypothetical protein